MSETYEPGLPTNAQSDGSVIGPILPPHLLEKPHNRHNEPKAASAVIGPALPPHLLEQTITVNDDTNSPDESSTSSDVSVDKKSAIDSSTDAYGPALPPHLQKNSNAEDSDDEDAYGPLPTGVSSSSQAHQALEERALQIKLSQLDSKTDKAKVREEWMLELPEVGSRTLGLGPRQFRKNNKPDFSDRSSWTDTPEQKAKKVRGKTEVQVDLRKEAELQQISKRDEEQAQMAERHSKKKRPNKSLLEIHQDKLKKKKKEENEEGLPTRRPFDREIDLKVNQFDDAQKKSILKKAMHLDDRFSSGQSKFL